LKRVCDVCKDEIRTGESSDFTYLRGNVRDGVRIALRVRAIAYQSIPRAKLGQTCEKKADLCQPCLLKRMNELCEAPFKTDQLEVQDDDE